MDKNRVDKNFRPMFLIHMYMRNNFAPVEIPTHFLSKIEEEVPDTAILRDSSGRSWSVKVRQERNGIVLADGWENFSVHHSLVPSASFLLFRYCGNWCFEVDIFACSGLEKEIVDASGNSEASPSGVKSKKDGRGKRTVRSVKDNLPKSYVPGPRSLSLKNKKDRRGKRSVGSAKDHLPKYCVSGPVDIFGDSGLEKEIVSAGGNNEAGSSGVKNKKGGRGTRSVGSVKDHLPKSCVPGPLSLDLKNKKDRRGKRSVGSAKDHLPKYCVSGPVDFFGDSGLEKEIVSAGGNNKAGPSGVKNKKGGGGTRSVGSMKEHLPKSRVPGPGVPYRTRIAWNPERLGLYLDSCLEEAAKGRRRSGNLTPESWQKVQSVFKEKTNIDLTPTQLSNFWSVLRKRYMVWSKIIAEAGNGGYDPVANKINWNQKQWEEYIKVNPVAKRFRKKKLEYPEKMKLLFGCYTAVHEDGGVSSDEMYYSSI
ncbi:uncharacterized protein [Coffea arabica]|uniref:Uncharacterized protein isoform X1 n=1 Tax=Coffea arabica TaxID=13443 RepID=A0ABM4VRN0_COFAR